MVKFFFYAFEDTVINEARRLVNAGMMMRVVQNLKTRSVVSNFENFPSKVF